MATTVALTGNYARPSGAMNLVGDPIRRIFPPVGANSLILVGDIIVDAGVYDGGTGTATPPASATGIAQGVNIITVSGSTLTKTATNTTSAAALQGAIHDSFMGVSESFRSYNVTTTGTVSDYLSVAWSGQAKFSLVPTVLDGSGYTGQGTAGVIGQLVAVAISAVNSSNYFILVDNNNLPYVELIPFESGVSGAGLDVAIGYLSKPVSATDTTATVQFLGQVFGGIYQPIV